MSIIIKVIKCKLQFLRGESFTRSPEPMKKSGGRRFQSIFFLKKVIGSFTRGLCSLEKVPPLRSRRRRFVHNYLHFCIQNKLLCRSLYSLICTIQDTTIIIYGLRLQPLFLSCLPTTTSIQHRYLWWLELIIGWMTTITLEIDDDRWIGSRSVMAHGSQPPWLHEVE